MPLDLSPSPVAPPAASRLWTAGASAGVSVAALTTLSVLHQDLAPALLGTAVLVSVATWAVNRRRPAQRPTSILDPAAGEPAEAIDHALLDSAFEALVDPVIVVSGGEADDIAGRRIVLANAAARDLFRIQREGALLVSALREPGVLEAFSNVRIAFKDETFTGTYVFHCHNLEHEDHGMMLQEEVSE